MEMIINIKEKNFSDLEIGDFFTIQPKSKDIYIKILGLDFIHEDDFLSLIEYDYDYTYYADNANIITANCVNIKTGELHLKQLDEIIYPISKIEITI